MHILIIDDDPDLRNLLGHYIKQKWPTWAVDEYDPLERNFPAADFPSWADRRGCRARERLRPEADLPADPGVERPSAP